MEKKQPLDIARGMIDAFNARDWNRLSELTAPNAVYDEIATGRKLTGRDDILEALKGWTRAFSDVKGTIDQSAADRDRVLFEVTFKGTHDGELQAPTGPIKPTGKYITNRTVQVLRVVDGHIVESRNYFDMLGMLKSVDALPTRAAHRAGA
jgi:steroid delta-isomerase-like uncharacterized protein